MTTPLISHIKKFIQLSDEESAGILNAFRHTSIKKKTDLFKEGNLCRNLYFVESGCLRLYFTHDDGQEQTTQFALENWWLTDFEAFHAQKTAGFSLQAVEKSEIFVISFDELEKLLTVYPVLEKYFRLIYQRFTSAAQKRQRIFYEFSREELYLAFVSNFPGFAHRIPQYLLASFLGVTPEYLSEIRKRSASESASAATRKRKTF